MRYLQFNLGEMYDTGRGGPTRLCGARRSWYRKAADQGHAVAQYNLGVMYAKGQGGPARLYSRNAVVQQGRGRRGVAKAQYNLALMYAKGQGVPRDYTAATADGTARAAEQGGGCGSE